MYYLLAAVLLVLPGLSRGQEAAPASGQIPAEVQAPTEVQAAPSSSVDLLRQAAKKNSPFASPSSKKTPKIPVRTVTAPADTAAEPADAQPAAPQAPAPAVTASKTPAVPAPQVPAVTTPAKVSASKSTTADNTLDMPLTIGGTTTRVQTKVTPKKTARPRQKVQPVAAQPQETVLEQPVENTEEDAADAELEYAVKMLEKSKQEVQSGRSVPPPAGKTKPAKVPSAKKAFNPNAFRPGVTWIASKSTHFDIYTQKPNGSISSPNMALTFETAYDTLRRFIPWMMSGRVRVFVYQDHDSYLRYEPEAKPWTRAMAYPTRGEIVVYDEPGKTQELKEVFSHELTHIFTQQFFDKHQTGRIMTPTWLDEGLAVFVEDQMFGGKGGPWDQDYRTLRFERDPSTLPANFSSHKMFGSFEPKSFTPISQRGQAVGPRRGKPVRLTSFADFMQEGSLDTAEGRGKGQVQNWYLQAYLMVRFLLTSSPSNRMRFEQFTRLIAEGEAVRDPSTGFLVKDKRGQQVYEPYSVEKALSRAYQYNNISSFEDAFWKWLSQ